MKPESCYWDENTKKLVGDRISKIRAYLRLKLIRPDKEAENKWEVDPTPGRHQIHTVTKENELWECTCQKNAIGDICSHILAVKLFEDGVQSGGRDRNEGWIRKENEDKELFQCKLCRRWLPNHKRSTTKKERCIYCTGGK